MRRRKEKRTPIVCPNCGCKMVCMNRIESIYNLIRGFYIWYVCPRREKEDGCGHSALVEMSPKRKRFLRIVTPAKVKKR
jgi:hypothetical protein